MSFWGTFPANYRAAEVQAIRAAVQAGECAAVIGLSGAGKSNLLGYLAARQAAAEQPRYVLVDGNRLRQPTAAAFLELMTESLEQAMPGTTSGAQSARESDALGRLDIAIGQRAGASICFLLDWSLLLDRDGRLFAGQEQGLWANLRALRDRHKYELTYVAATRHALPRDNELAELFFGHSLWLGPLSDDDARWNVARYAERVGQRWEDGLIEAIVAASGRYPALLRAVCEACAAGCPPESQALARQAAVAARIDEFWADRPDDAELRAAGLDTIELLMSARPHRFDTTQLTAKESQLLQALQARAGEVYDKDDLIRAVWPEDRVYESGVRDDSLAQLVRRLREKIEPEAGKPRYIQTVPGRGYRFVKQTGGSE